MPILRIFEWKILVILKNNIHETVLIRKKIVVNSSKARTDPNLIFQVDLALEAFNRLGVDLDLIKPIPHENCLYEPADIEPCGPF